MELHRLRFIPGLNDTLLHFFSFIFFLYFIIQDFHYCAPNQLLSTGVPVNLIKYCFKYQRLYSPSLKLHFEVFLGLLCPRGSIFLCSCSDFREAWEQYLLIALTSYVSVICQVCSSRLIEFFSSSSDSYSMCFRVRHSKLSLVNCTHCLKHYYTLFTDVAKLEIT